MLLLDLQILTRLLSIEGFYKRGLSFFFRFCAVTGLFLVAAALFAVWTGTARAQTTATYTVTFEGNWTTESTPGGVAGGAHFTTLIGAVHNNQVTFWREGGTATAGVEGVAEFGSTGTFKSEINSAAAGTVRSIVEKSGTFATGTSTFEVEFSRSHPLLTLLSMIGPSPDWFVGVSGLSLLDGQNWRSFHSVDLFAYDAGTEEGEGFSLSNPATSPKDTITRLKGVGKFSNVRMARLSFTLKSPPQNNPPEFSGTSTTRSFSETIGSGVVQVAGYVGASVIATDQDGDTIAYSLEGADAGKFSIVSGSGQIRTRVGQRYDRESKTSYSVMVRADDGKGGMDTIAVTINVTDVNEPPEVPAAPSVFSGAATSVSVMWNAPSNTGRPAITDYDLQYRSVMTGSWMNGPQGVSGTTETISGLTEDTSYEVRVRATNSDGDSAWSSPGTGRTNARGNEAPKFSDTSPIRSFAETVGDATSQSADDVGAAVTAVDQNGDTLAYSLVGTDAGKFSIVSGSGQIRTRVGQRYDRESKASYSVMVRADDGNGGMDTVAVTINLTNVLEPPAAPRAPSVSSSGAVNLNVRWNVPANAGRPEITGYRVQYRRGTSGQWTDFSHSGTGTSAMIPVSDTNVRHQARVQAINSEGESPWSQSGSSVVSTPSSPSSPQSRPSPPLSLPPVMQAGNVGTSDELKTFVLDAVGRIEASDTFEKTLHILEEFRDKEKDWNNGSMYLVLLTRRGGVYFHANDREVEDMDWSGLVFCEGGESVLDSQDGCLIESGGASSGYAHPFSASHVPLAHGDEEFVLLGGFDETPEGTPLTGEIGVPETEAGDVDTDNELREFVLDAGRSVGEAVEDPDIDPAELRGTLRSEGPWRGGDVHVYIMDETGRVIFDGADRNREQKDEHSKQHVRDIIENAGKEIVGYTEGGMQRRGYAVRVEVSLDEGGEDSRVYIVGSGYREEERQGSGSGSSGGGCAVGGNSSGSAFGMFLAALTLFLAVLLKRHSVCVDRTH